MKRKVIMSLLIIVILTISRYYIINAASETSEVEILANIDTEKNITLNLQASNINGFEGIINYNSDILDYVGIEGQNNWEVSINSETLLFIARSQNSNNTEKKDIAIIKFKPKNVENTFETNISITTIKLVKEDSSSSELEDLNVTISMNTNVNGEDSNSNNGETIESEITDGSDEVIIEGDKIIDYGGDSQVDEEVDGSVNGEEGEEGESSIVNENLAESGGEEEEYEIKVTEDDVESKEEDVLKEETNKQTEELEEDNIANKNLPQTGTKGIIVITLIIAVLLTIAYVTYKKYKQVK